MISFIVIGRNEGWKLTKCLQSVYGIVEYNKLLHYEVIYIDSKSEDDSIDRAKKFNGIRIIKLTDSINAAIARNAGANLSSGDFLFFIDGDMEINSDFLPLVYDETNGLKYDFVSGQMKYIYYDTDNKYIGEELYFKRCMKKDAIYHTVGGLFLIKRKYWELVGGMNNKYKKSQDYDLAFRLAKRKIHLLRKKEIIGNTSMISYSNPRRMYADILNKNTFYPRSLIYREHFFNKYMWPTLARNDSSLIMLLITLSISLFCLNILWLFVYFIFIIIRSFQRNRSLKDSLIRIPYYILRDSLVILGFLFFYPKKIKSSAIQYNVID